MPRTTDEYRLQTGPFLFGLARLAALTLVLTACAGNQPQQPQPQPEQQPRETPGTETPSVAQLHQWTIIGKLGVRSPRDNGSANLTWKQQSAPNYHIHLSGPLGAGATVISGSPAGVSLQRGNEPAMHARDPAQLTLQTLGWPLPVGEMFYWVRGLAAPGSKADEQRNSQGQLLSLHQAGWRLIFSGYQAIGAYSLPTRIKAETNQAAGPVSVTLVIKEWLPKGS
ncbi:lipoprotein insertase outer membrane protein LolB [Microbulbifer discodermiae]|uniref:lipoprotein insertase outer membrane protein LolB n=1 Tax=Microbulbifer sp. 2201CG32-9 TaxID=3232309 RepID=UPI00345B947A